jgi:uroporphyrinogen decarboxylase
MSDLSYRERFALTLAHRSVDRPPMDLAATDMTGIEGGPRILAAQLGLRLDRLEPEAQDEAVLRALDTDIRDVGGIIVPPTPLQRRVSDTRCVDAWGIEHEWNGHHYEMVGRPLAGATIADLERHPWPRVEDIEPRCIERLRQRARFLFEETPYVVCGRHPTFGVFELGCWMCGFDDFLCRLAGDPQFVHRFFERFLAFQKRMNEVYYGAIGRYLHFTTSGDDFGTQTGPFMSPGMFRDLIVPYFAERIRHIRTFTDARFFHHTCGAVFPLIPDLIAAGVEILNPIQPRATDMEPARLKAAYGERLTFYGGVDTQYLLPRGPAARVTAETRELARVLGRDGGYILSAAHHLQEDVPLANVVAMYRAVMPAGAARLRHR